MSDGGGPLGKPGQRMLPSIFRQMRYQHEILRRLHRALQRIVFSGAGLVFQNHVDRDDFGMRGGQQLQPRGDDGSVFALATHGSERRVVNREDDAMRRLWSGRRESAEHPIVGRVIDLWSETRPSSYDRDHQAGADDAGVSQRPLTWRRPFQSRRAPWAALR